MTPCTHYLRWWLEPTGSLRVFRTVRVRIKNSVHVHCDVMHAPAEVVAGINRQLKFLGRLGLELRTCSVTSCTHNLRWWLESTGS